MKLSTVLWRKAAQALVVAPRQVLCKLSDLEIDVGKEVFLCSGAARSLILLLRENNNSNSISKSKTPFPRISAYINMCPHVGVPLNMFPDLFLTTDKVTAQRTCSLVFFSRSFRLSLIPAPSHRAPNSPPPPCGIHCSNTYCAVHTVPSSTRTMVCASAVRAKDNRSHL